MAPLNATNVYTPQQLQLYTIYIPFFQPYLLELFAATYLNPIDHHESPTMSAGQKHLSLELIQI